VDPTENFHYRALVKPTLFWLSFFPDEIGAGPGLKVDPFLLKHVLMPWVVAIAIGVGLTGRGLPLPCLAQRSAHPLPHPARPPASSPALPGGAGAVMARPGGKPCPGLHASGNTRMGSQIDQLFRRALPPPCENNYGMAISGTRHITLERVGIRQRKLFRNISSRIVGSRWTATRTRAIK
jgi:hypothetical protein